MKFSQKGFAALEIILITVIVVVVGGIGWYAYNSKQKTDRILNQADKISQNTPVKSSPANSNTTTQKYLVIKEWGIRIPYSGTDTYSYKVGNEGLVDIISGNLAKTYGCKDMGAGELIKDAPTDPFGPSIDAPTAQQTEKQYPGTFKVIGGYYYTHVHDQAACSETVPVAAQNEANDAIHALIPKIEAIPQ